MVVEMAGIKKMLETILQYKRFFYNLLLFFLLLHAAYQEKSEWYALLDILVSVPLASEFLRCILEQIKNSKPQGEDLDEINLEDE